MASQLQEETNGLPDISIKEFFRDRDRFADLCNGILYDGEEIVKGKELSEVNTEIAIHEKGKDAVNLKRDLAYLWSGEYTDEKKGYKNFPIQIVYQAEDQMRMEYEIPARLGRYEFEGEHQEIRTFLKKKQKAKQETKSKKESESGRTVGTQYLQKEDTIPPTVSFCVYYGKTPWSVPTLVRKLYGKNFPEKLIRKKVCFAVDAVVADVGHIEYPFHHPEVRDLCALLRIAYRKGVDRDEKAASMAEYVDNNNVSDDVLRTIRSIKPTGADDLFADTVLKAREDGETVKGLMAAYVEAEEKRIMDRGMKRGMERGIISAALELGAGRDQVLELLGKNMHLSREDAAKALEEYDRGEN